MNDDSSATKVLLKRESTFEHHRTITNQSIPYQVSRIPVLISQFVGVDISNNVLLEGVKFSKEENRGIIHIIDSILGFTQITYDQGK